MQVGEFKLRILLMREIVQLADTHLLTDYSGQSISRNLPSAMTNSPIYNH